MPQLTVLDSLSESAASATPAPDMEQMILFLGRNGYATTRQLYALFVENSDSPLSLNALGKRLGRLRDGGVLRLRRSGRHLVWGLDRGGPQVKLAEAVRAVQDIVDRRTPAAVLDISGDNQALYRRLAVFYRRRGDLPRAIKYYSRLLQKEPLQVSAALILTELLLKNGRTVQALQLVQRLFKEYQLQPKIERSLNTGKGGRTTQLKDVKMRKDLLRLFKKFGIRSPKF